MFFEILIPAFVLISQSQGKDTIRTAITPKRYKEKVTALGNLRD
jgi:hypothetical protein